MTRTKQVSAWVTKFWMPVLVILCTSSLIYTVPKVIAVGTLEERAEKRDKEEEAQRQLMANYNMSLKCQKMTNAALLKWAYDFSNSEWAKKNRIPRIPKEYIDLVSKELEKKE